MLVRYRVHFPIRYRSFHDLRSYKEDPRWPGWQVIIGIETHAQIKSRRKLFSESLTSSLLDIPNTNVSPFDAAFPGTLPKLNSKCVDLALRTALALKCRISKRSSFDRKHYFYSDLPSGYQITQQYAPIAKNGALEINLHGSSRVNVRIKQIQLEQDTAKSSSNPRTQSSQIDLNRAGAGLMEIVTEPDLRSPEEAGGYVRTLQSVLRAMGSSDGNMEQGSFRCDVNVSVNRKGEPPGTRCEIKNLNSVKFMMAAITHEIKRQTDFLTSQPGLNLPQETRGFNENSFETYRLRSKEDAPDYRYMPDPNLGVLFLSQPRIEEIQNNLPLLPWEVRSFLMDKYPELQGKEQSLDVLLTADNTREIAFDGEDNTGPVKYFEQTLHATDRDGNVIKRDPGAVLNWLTNDLFGLLSARKQSFGGNSLSYVQFAEIIDLVQNGTITRSSSKLLLRHMLASPSSRSSSEIAAELQLNAMNSTSDPSSEVSLDLHSLCENAIANLPNEVASARAGNKNVLNRLVGHVMRQSRGRVDAKEVKLLLEKMFNGNG